MRGLPCGSISILSPNPARFSHPSNSVGLCVFSVSLRSGTCQFSVRFFRRLSSPTTCSRRVSLGLAPVPKLFAAAGSVDDGAAEQFLENNSILNFVRFSRGDCDSGVGRCGVGELQTAVLSYRKKFPWSLLLPFLRWQMARVLSLDFQLDCLVYQDDVWYHADLDYETFKSLQLARGESFFTFAGDMTVRSTEASVQPALQDDLGPWRSKSLWASRVLPMPLFGLLINGSVCAPAENQTAELEAFSTLEFGGEDLLG